VDDDPISFGFAAIQELALPTGNTAQYVYSGVIPAGTQVLIGEVHRSLEISVEGFSSTYRIARYELFGDDPLIVTRVLSRGFRIEDPDVLAPWGSSVAEVLKAFAAAGAGEPRQVTPLYTIARARLGGLQCQVGFHFEQGLLVVLTRSSSRNVERDIEASYRAFKVKSHLHCRPPRTVPRAM